MIRPSVVPIGRHPASFLALGALLGGCVGGASTPTTTPAPTSTDTPPAWTDRPYVEEEGHAVVVGTGAGPDERAALNDALAHARRLALETNLRVAHSGVSDAGTAMSSPPAPAPTTPHETNPGGERKRAPVEASAGGFDPAQARDKPRLTDRGGGAPPRLRRGSRLR